MCQMATFNSVVICSKVTSTDKCSIADKQQGSSQSAPELTFYCSWLQQIQLALQPVSHRANGSQLVAAHIKINKIISRRYNIAFGRLVSASSSETTQGQCVCVTLRGGKLSFERRNVEVDQRRWDGKPFCNGWTLLTTVTSSSAAVRKRPKKSGDTRHVEVRERKKSNRCWRN